MPKKDLGNRSNKLVTTQQLYNAIVKVVKHLLGFTRRFHNVRNKFKQERKQKSGEGKTSHSGGQEASNSDGHRACSPGGQKTSNTVDHTAADSEAPKTSSVRGINVQSEVNTKSSLPAQAIAAPSPPIRKCKGARARPKLETFTLFPLLPPEIRLQIWHYASTNPRVIELLIPSSVFDIAARPTLLTHTAPRPPAVLHTCSESRSLALPLFTHLWLDSPHPLSKGMIQVQIQAQNDIVFIRRRPPYAVEWDVLLSPGLRRQLNSLKRLALIYADCPFDYISRHAGQDFEVGQESIARRFSNLDELILVWARDWQERSFEGRARNVFRDDGDVCDHATWCFEGYCSAETKAAAERARQRVRDTWRRSGVWEALERVEPVVRVWHWCGRDGEAW